MIQPTTKGRIQNAALDLLLSKGYDATSVGEIAETVGVSKPAVYYHFGSKRELLLELLAGLFDGMVSGYVGTLSELATLREIVGGVIHMVSEIRQVFGGQTQGDVGYLPLMVDAVRHFPDEVGDEIDGFYRELVELLAERAEDARATGEIRASVDPEAFGIAMVALVEGLLLVGSLAPSCDFAGREEALVDVIWSGVADATVGGAS